MQGAVYVNLSEFKGLDHVFTQLKGELTHNTLAIVPVSAALTTMGGYVLPPILAVWVF